MCGRYSLIADIGELQERFGFDGSELTHAPRYNVAPTQMALTVTNGSERRGSYMRWGLIPSWAKSASVGNRVINARTETVAEMPSFRTALQRRRCLVLADGFYEWQGKGSSRRPMRITMASGEPFAFVVTASDRDSAGALLELPQEFFYRDVFRWPLRNITLNN